LTDAESQAPKIREWSRAMFEAPGARGRVVADETKLGAQLHAALAADVAAAPEIGFVHRKLAYGDIYFLANTSNHPVHSQATFRVTGLEAAWFDPFTGRRLELAATASTWIWRPTNPGWWCSPKSTWRPVRAHWPGAGAGGPQLGLEGHVRGIDGARHYDRAALLDRGRGEEIFLRPRTYEKTVTVDQAMAASKRPLYLNFGEGTPVTVPERRSTSGMRAMLEGPVREAAVVTVNGKRAGAVWCAPYEVEVGGLLHAGENTIRVVVANLAINEMAKGPLWDYKALIAKYGERFQDQDTANLQPLPSGLLGPVRLIAK